MCPVLFVHRTIHQTQDNADIMNEPDHILHIKKALLMLNKLAIVMSCKGLMDKIFKVLKKTASERRIVSAVPVRWAVTTRQVQQTTNGQRFLLPLIARHFERSQQCLSKLSVEFYLYI
ncbi:hypothetical protein AVEN_71376-1 [Araneus ventricosus]|uniref:Uncharacterized protein n=1 Tax=Araneus ventricosus TaxID=182803 RepID=A0A4Y2BJ19_ARAVE|nr:hypothetical protein AVEN_71376-1 [Araneus ventricosus]